MFSLRAKQQTIPSIPASGDYITLNAPSGAFSNVPLRT